MNVEGAGRIIRRIARRVVSGRWWTPTYPFQRELYPRCSFVRTYWWTGELNFGDLLTPWLLMHYGIATIHAPLERSELVAVGSVLQQLPSDWSGIVLGSGVIQPSQLGLRSARILGVRGHLSSSSFLGEQPRVLGDPGLLVGCHYSRRDPIWRLGVVPHYVHKGHPQFKDLGSLDSSVKLIDVQRTPARVIRDISACSAIATSSLHGLIVADSLGIPALWMVPEPKVAGGEFKFVDYESVVTPGTTRRFDLSGEESPTEIIAQTALADSECVRAAQTRLLSAIAALQVMLAGSSRSPLLAPVVWMRSGAQSQRIGLPDSG